VTGLPPVEQVHPVGQPFAWVPFSNEGLLKRVLSEIPVALLGDGIANSPPASTKQPTPNLWKVPLPLIPIRIHLKKMVNTTHLSGTGHRAISVPI
jgi:hypothetical protein